MHPWAFRARFRRAAFGWKGSKLAIERIHEALAEIRAVARQDTTAAAEGAVLFLEKLPPALNQVDSSSGALGNATPDQQGSSAARAARSGHGVVWQAARASRWRMDRRSKRRLNRYCT